MEKGAYKKSELLKKHKIDKKKSLSK